MELALQVVGLKMTGKIEDAKNVAMRIVGNAGDSSDSQGRSDSMMQLASISSTRDLRPLLLRGGENEGFETMILKFLSILDTPLDRIPSSVSISEATSHRAASGQTLLHLAAFLGFPTLVRFLVEHDVDLDMRDRNGFTALHFAVFSQSRECATILVNAGADKDIVNSAGKTPEEIAVDGFFDGLDLVDTGDEQEDEEAHWGDGEEDASDNTRRTRIVSRRTNRRLHPPGSIPTPATVLPEDIMPMDPVDEKHTAWFMEMIQRTLAQLPAAPQLPLPDLKNIPYLPGMPAVPWGALPQLPVVFPVFVPMTPGWPSFLGGGVAGDADGAKPKDGEVEVRGMGAGAIKLAQEQWRNTWEKWVTLAVAANPRQQTEPPPMYTPRATEDSSAENQASGSQTLPIETSTETPVPSDTRHTSRRISYDVPPAVSAQEVDAYTYQRRPQPKKREFLC